ncbi:hypothetical protein MHBO_000524 [Bonamia ostreae]|uniref:Uncharacterized protein n=1 Tax=Bonamia ostreae TaxID=126728 RepID=A0ABV2AFX3_9EUKA
MAELSSKAALLSFFIKPEWAAENCDRGIPRKEDFSGVEAELKNFFGGDDGFIAQTNLFFLEPHSRVDVLLVVGDEDRLRDVEEMARSDEGLFLMDHKTTYSKYDQQVLPRLRKTAQKQLTGLAANGILGLHGAYKGANQMASDWELQQKAEKARKSIYDVFQNVDEKTGISGIARSISESAKSLGEEANRRASKVDSDMGISEKIGSIKGDMSRHVAKLSENESVKSGLNFITGIFSSAKEKIEGFTEETMDIVGSELQETKRPSDKDDGAKVEHLGKDREGSDVAENEISFTAEEMDRKSRE